MIDDIIELALELIDLVIEWPLGTLIAGAIGVVAGVVILLMLFGVFDDHRMQL